MKNIFIDSNIFIKENYLQGKYIKALLKLGQDSVINIYTHDIIIGEVKNNFKKHLEESLIAYKHFTKSGARYLRNVTIGHSIVTYEKLKIEELYNEFDIEFDKRLREANLMIIPYSNVNIKSVFEDYFDKKPPFGLKEEKKHGFPDAFLIEFIKKWVDTNGEELIVLTADNDFNHLNNYEGLVQIQNKHRVFVDEVNKELIRSEKLKEFRIQKVNEIITNQTENIKSKTQDYIEDYIYDASIYYPLVNYMDIHDMSNLRFGDILEFDIFLVKILNAEEIEVEISFKFKFELDVSIDDENESVYDSEDKIMHYFETIDVKADGICTIHTSVILSIIDEGDFEEEVSLDLDKEDITIEVHTHDDYFY